MNMWYLFKIKSKTFDNHFEDIENIDINTNYKLGADHIYN